MKFRSGWSIVALLISFTVQLSDGQLKFNTPTCQGDDYECLDGQTCVHMTDICDGKKDCPGGEDESAYACPDDSCTFNDPSCPLGSMCTDISLNVYRCIACDPNCKDTKINCGLGPPSGVAYYAFPCFDFCRAGFEYYGDPTYFYPNYECVDIDECINTTCDNGGTCVNSPGSFTCKCAPGFIGDDCSLVDHCYPYPCKNKGKCVNKATGYECRCRTGFGGDICQMKCHPKCRATSGCSKYGRGKCDSSCIPGYHLTPKTRKCRDNRCWNRLYRNRQPRRCGWRRSKSNRPNRNRRRRG